MTVDYNDFAVFAEPLKNGSTEIEWRMCAGRAYYAAYHRAKESSASCPDNSLESMGSHQRVSDRFIKHGSLPARSIAYVLISMKKFRKLADYDLSDSFDQSAAVNQVAQYKALLAKLEIFDTVTQKSA